MEFIHQQSNGGMTVTPNIDDATGEHLGFDAQEIKPFGEQIIDNTTLTPEELEDALGPQGYQDYLAQEQEQGEQETLSMQEVETVLSEPTAPNDAIAQEIMTYEPQSYEAQLVQVLAAQYYSGEITVDQAVAEAKATGADMDKLRDAFSEMYNTFKNQNR